MHSPHWREALKGTTRGLGAITSGAVVVALEVCRKRPRAVAVIKERSTTKDMGRSLAVLFFLSILLIYII
jgi:hypothetical protein